MFSSAAASVCLKEHPFGLKFARAKHTEAAPSFLPSKTFFPPSLINNPAAFSVTPCSQRRHYAAITSAGSTQALCVMVEMELLLLHKSDLVRRNSTPPHSFNCEDHFFIFATRGSSAAPVPFICACRSTLNKTALTEDDGLSN